LRQRIRLRTELEPFTEAELHEYLRQQVTAAGGEYDRIFAPGAVAALHRYSQGVARLANTLCESALDIAAVQQQKQLTGELVAKTAVTLLGLAEPTPAVQPAAASAPPVEARPAPRPAAPTAPIFERRAEPRMPAPPASAIPTEARPGPLAPPAAAAPPPPPPPPPAPADIEYDGSVTDVADIALADFPVLTDAVDTPAPEQAKPAIPAPAKAAPSAPQASSVPAAAKAAAPAPQAPSASGHPKPAPPAAASAPAKPAAARPAPRVEVPSSPPRPAPKPMPAAPVAPTTTPLPHAAAAKPTAETSRDVNANEAPRQPPAGRGIAEAKSIDDLSDLDAETLFADAELDLVSAALASAAEWPDDDEVAAPKPAPARSTAAAPAPPRPAPAKPAAPAEDAFDLFGLDDNAPLELIDDSTLPPASPRKTASR
jgi:hypothetical protein